VRQPLECGGSTPLFFYPAGAFARFGVRHFLCRFLSQRSGRTATCPEANGTLAVQHGAAILLSHLRFRMRVISYVLQGQSRTAFGETDHPEVGPAPYGAAE